MYPYLFGNQSLKMYDLIGICGYVILLTFFLTKKNRPLTPVVGEESGKTSAWLWVALPMAVHLVAFTLGGEKLGDYIGRGTEFFGYVAVSAVGMALAAATLGAPPLTWLDRTVPLYLCLASVLKLSCFCGGCCYGLPWEHGLYNARCDEVQFPIQLAESAAYALLWPVLSRYRGRAGSRFALFLTAYAAIRFAVQFFRGDKPIFSPFHWMSAVFAVLGAVMWLVCRFIPEKEQRST